MKKMLIVAVCALPLLAGTAFAQLEEKDPNAPNPGPGSGIGSRATGGPDAYGYIWFDQADGCTATLQDVSGTGALLVSGDDSSGVAALGGPAIDIYGNSYASLTGATNGYISTDPTDTGPDLSNDCPLPAAPSTGGGDRLYPLHDDLLSDIYFEYFPVCPEPGRFPGVHPGCNVFTYDNTTHFGGGGEMWQQSVLVHDSGDFSFAVGAGNPEAGSGSTTGIQNVAATDGLTYACDAAASVPDNTSVCFWNPFAMPVELQSFDIQ